MCEGTVGPNRSFSLFKVASMSPVCQVGMKMTERVSSAQFLNLRVHETLGGQFRFGERSKFKRK